MKTFAFDLGRVIFDFDYNIALNKIRKKISISPDKIIEELFYKDFATDFEKGLVSSHNFYLKFKNTFCDTLDFENFSEIWSNIFSPNKDVIQLIEQLKGQYPLYMISNINELHFEFLYEKYKEVFSHFNSLILSYKVKSVKPEKKIYEELKNTANTSYENIIYIDDRQDLIEEARKLNLNCIQFIDFKQLKSRLAGLNIPV
jgi:putative hydrolase of the HAD superfamily